MVRPGAVAGLLAGLVLGCGGVEEGGDAASNDAQELDGTVVAQPDIPWLDDGAPPFEIAPCPDGWREVDDGGVRTCDPYPEGGALDCPAGEAHFPGEPGCAPVGSPCPTAGEFSEMLPVDATRIVYVRAGAPPGGDGTSPATAYAGLTDFSTAALPVGSVIALSRGTHTGPVRLARDAALWGACAAETAVTTPEPSTDDGIVSWVGSAGEVHDLTLSDSPRRGVRLDGADSDGSLAGVVVESTEVFGIFAIAGARLQMRSVLVRDIRSRSDRTFGRGLNVQSEATADLSRAIIDRARGVGVFAAEPGASVTLADVVVRDTQPSESDGAGGRGLDVERGGRAEATGVAFERNRELATYGHGDGSTVTLTDVVVRDTRGRESDGIGGQGIGVSGGANASLDGVLFERNRDVGVSITDTGSASTLTDVVIRDTGGNENDATFGRGFNVQHGATADANRVLLERNHDTGMGVLDTSSVMLTDVVIRDMRGQRSDSTRGRGIDVHGGSTVQGTRVLVERSLDLGVSASGEDTVTTLADLVVRDTMERACVDSTCSDFGSGHTASAYGRASLSLTRFTIARAALCGLLIARDGEADLSDGEIRQCLIGICLQVDGFDPDRLRRRVRYVDNDVALQATDMPIPEVADAVPQL